MNQDRIAELAEKLRNGNATQQEIEELEKYWDWAQKDNTLFESMTLDEREAVRSTMFENISNQIATARGKQRSLILQPWTLRIAAAVAIAVISFVLWNPSTHQVQLATQYGEQKNIVLPDGSSVKLNGNSSLKYADEWNEETPREIWIKGEAFFDVVHTQNDQKFIVHTEDALDVQVLGTRFNVKARSEKTEVMLEEGRVRLSVDVNGGTDTLTMKPGELVVKAKQQVVKSKVNAAEYSSWKDNKLFFSETPLLEVARILEDTYGFEVEFKHKSLNERKLSGEIRSARGEDILTAIRESLDIKITEDGRKIVFHSK